MRNKYEVNPLSLIDGGSKIKITFKNGVEKQYENIKDVTAYVVKVLKESDYAIDKIEVEEKITVKEWRPVFGRSRSFIQTLM